MDWTRETGALATNWSQQRDRQGRTMSTAQHDTLMAQQADEYFKRRSREMLYSIGFSPDVRVENEPWYNFSVVVVPEGINTWRVRCTGNFVGMTVICTATPARISGEYVTLKLNVEFINPFLQRGCPEEEISAPANVADRTNIVTMLRLGFDNGVTGQRLPTLDMAMEVFRLTHSTDAAGVPVNATESYVYLSRQPRDNIIDICSRTWYAMANACQYVYNAVKDGVLRL